MDCMNIESKFLSKIISKFINRKLSKKFNASDIHVNVEQASVKLDGAIGSFSIVLNGSFTQNDITQITKMLLLGGSDE